MQMPTQQQITLDDLLSMLMARVDAMSMAEENLKTKMNILGEFSTKREFSRMRM